MGHKMRPSLNVYVSLYVVLVYGLAILFATASSDWHGRWQISADNRASRVARAYCRYRHGGFSESTALGMAVHDHQHWMDDWRPGSEASTDRLAEAIAERCPRFRLMSEPDPMSSKA